MSLTESGDIKYEFKKAWSNGKNHVLLSPLELIEKLCALVPLPRMYLVRYSGASSFLEGVEPSFGEKVCPHCNKLEPTLVLNPPRSHKLLDK